MKKIIQSEIVVIKYGYDSKGLVKMDSVSDRIQELYNEARRSIVEGDEDLALETVEKAKAEDMDLMDLLLNGFGRGNEDLAEEYDKGRISIAELIYGSEIMKNVTDEVFDFINAGRKEGPIETGKPRVLLATVAGDIHDIGKGIVAACLRSAGFEVIDLGCEIPVEAIAGAAKEFNVDIIGTSALLTTTLTEQKKLEKYLRDLGERGNYATMVGGAPCTDKWARRIGADAYSANAMEAVEVARELIRQKKNSEEKTK